MRQHFYHQTTRSYIVAFASLFDSIFCTTGGGEQTPVPIHYAPKSKFYAILDEDEDKDETDFETSLPRMAFELQGMNYAPERHTNPMHQLRNNEDNALRSYNRIAYDFNFGLYVATKEFDDSLEIIEQIAPMFTPDFTVSIIEKVGGLEIPTNLSIILNSTSFNIDYEGPFDSIRRIEWTMNFTLKGYLYPNVDRVARIKKAIVDMHLKDDPIPWITTTDAVEPPTAGKDDPHTIVSTVVERKP